jgi:hypothetical protein
MATRATYRERVKRGIKLLDEKVPSWRDRISCTELDLANADHCILGQVYKNDVKAGYYYALDVVPELTKDDGEKYGFKADSYHGYVLLDQLWRKKLCR